MLITNICIQFTRVQKTRNSSLTSARFGETLESNMGLFQFCGTELAADLRSDPFTEGSASGNGKPQKRTLFPQAVHKLLDRKTPPHILKNIIVFCFTLCRKCESMDAISPLLLCALSNSLTCKASLLGTRSNISLPLVSSSLKRLNFGICQI